ncbi:MAG: SurA N-terminal domain-containing protein [Desulfobacterales bacterium]
MRYFINLIALICLLGVGWALTSCADREQNKQDGYLIKVGDRIMTVADFTKAFEIAKSAYSYEILQKPEAVREAMLRLVRQMTEEMILLERAKETGVTVTSSEVEKTLADIKGDYPDNEFQNSLIENAVPYLSWKQALKRRLLMDKVIVKDLEDQIHVTPDDISEYEKAHPVESPAASDLKATEATASKTPDVKTMKKARHDAIVKLLRREKLEKVYPSWVEALKKKYTVEINVKELRKITDLQQIRKRLAF